jgi:hypothetical protein
MKTKGEAVAVRGYDRADRWATAELTARVRAIHGDLHSNGRPYVLGLYRSIAKVLQWTCLDRGRVVTVGFTGAHGDRSDTPNDQCRRIRFAECVDDCRGTSGTDLAG